MKAIELDELEADERDECEGCGGSVENVQGCLECCRDCGFPCSFEKDGEGFHASEDDDEFEDDPCAWEDDDE